MKNFVRIVGILLLFSLISCGNLTQKGTDAVNDTGFVSLKLTSGSTPLSKSRSIADKIVDEILTNLDISSISSWHVKVDSSDSLYGYEAILSLQDGDDTITLPIGTYSLEITATANYDYNGDSVADEVELIGMIQEFTVQKNETTELQVIVTVNNVDEYLPEVNVRNTYFVTNSESEYNGVFEQYKGNVSAVIQNIYNNFHEVNNSIPTDLEITLNFEDPAPDETYDFILDASAQFLDDVTYIFKYPSVSRTIRNDNITTEVTDNIEVTCRNGVYSFEKISGYSEEVVTGNQDIRVYFKNSNPETQKIIKVTNLDYLPYQVQTPSPGVISFMGQKTFSIFEGTCLEILDYEESRLRLLDNEPNVSQYGFGYFFDVWDTQYFTTHPFIILPGNKTGSEAELKQYLEMQIPSAESAMYKNASLGNDLKYDAIEDTTAIYRKFFGGISVDFETESKSIFHIEATKEGYVWTYKVVSDKQILKCYWYIYDSTEIVEKSEATNDEYYIVDDVKHTLTLNSLPNVYLYISLKIRCVVKYQDDDGSIKYDEFEFKDFQ